MDLGQLGKWIFLVGVFVALTGLFLWIGAKSGLPLGRLPGDLNIRREGFSFHFPLATSIILSIVLTIVLNIIIGLFRR